jgi:hypothetical protein
LRYDPPNSRTDVFPLDDTVTAAASVYVLAGRRTAGMDVTAVTAEVGGTLDLSGADPVVRLTISTAALNATSSRLRRFYRIKATTDRPQTRSPSPGVGGQLGVGEQLGVAEQLGVGEQLALLTGARILRRLLYDQPNDRGRDRQ